VGEAGSGPAGRRVPGHHLRPARLRQLEQALPRIDVPVLVVQGSQDRILPPEATGDRLPALIRDVRRVIIESD